MPQDNPIDPATGPRFILRGRIVTMDVQDSVVVRGFICIDSSVIRAVLPISAPLPPEFASAPVVNARGTIYPGLIDLHNHLSYNALPLWNPERRYQNRDEWGRSPAYRRDISGPMAVLGRSPGVVEAIVRYVECKCLLGGVTTSQGIELYSNQGIRRYYRGIVRNVEQTDEAALPEATTRIADVEAADVIRFSERLTRSSCLLLHLSEGIDRSAREHFLALQKPDGEWALAPQLAGIHAAGLEAADFQTCGSHGASIVWSPLSNLMLYGETAKVVEAKRNRVRIALGSDWSPSGSKNILGELKVARRVSRHLGNPFSSRDLVAMATIEAARVVRWDAHLGSIEPGKKADLLVIKNTTDDPYDALIDARESDIRLVVINGVPRFGVPSLMAQFVLPRSESWRVAGKKRALNLAQDTADPIVGALTLGEAKRTVSRALARLPELARNLERPAPPTLEWAAAPRWFLALDQSEPAGLELRPRLPYGARRETGAALAAPAAARPPLSSILRPMAIDPMTAVDDPDYDQKLVDQPNIPLYAKP